MVELNIKEVKSIGYRVCIEKNGIDVGHAYLYVMSNDIHSRPFGFVEDVFVDEACRGSGLGKDLINKVTKLAKEKNCYKMIFTSRFEKDKLHDYYEKQGFTKHGFEFRINFD
jgi:GNAT superfamily N-acetyltransferase